MSEQNLLTFEKALKEIYLPLWQNQLGIEPTPFLAKVKKTPLLGNEIVSAAPIGLSGGFGFSSEGKATPTAGAVKFERFKEKAKDMYVNVCISVKATKLGTTSGAMADALQTEVKAAYDTAKWNVGRALFGNGSGVLCNVDKLETAGNVISVDSIKNLKEGLIIDIYATGGTTPAVSGRRITAINRTPASGKYSVTIDGAATTLSAGFLTVQLSYNNEITGLRAIYDDSVTSLYGVSKSANPVIKPVVVDANAAIDDSIITKALRMAERDKGSSVDTLLCGDDAYDAYVEYLRTNNIRVEESSKEIVGGFRAIKFAFGTHEVDIVNESFVPDKEIYGVDSNAFKFESLDWTFADLQGGGVFNLMEGGSVYRALLTNYGNLICSNPGGCIRITNCAS